ncbi:hypothetical protein BB987_08350 [Photorhabdus temperata]|nr:hypothetical protein BB987_08350 [Photorhabdus temperata]
MFDFSLQFVQFTNTLQRLFGRRIGAGLVVFKELTPGMGPATRFGDSARVNITMKNAVTQ